MLILRRKTGESFLIGDDVRVTIVATKDKEVQIAIDAPKEVSVLRCELASAMNSAGSWSDVQNAQEQSLPQELLDAFAMLSHQPPEGAPGKPEK